MTLIAQKAPFSVMEATSKFRMDGINTFRQLREIGDLVYLPSMPGVINYLIFDPELAYDILVNHPDQYEKPELAKRMFRSSFGNGLFFSEGTFWRRQRKLAQPAFHHGRIAIYADRMVELERRQSEAWQAGQTLDIGKELHALTLIIVIDALFKTNVAAMTDQVGQAMTELGAVTLLQITSPIHAFMPPWVPTGLNRRKQIAVDSMNTILYQLITEHRQAGADLGDLLSTFIEAHDPETGDTMSDAQIRDELMTLFIAGHETSAVALSWAMLEIAQHPEVEAKLVAEVQSVLGGRAPTVDDLPKLPYVGQVVKETLRLYPPAIFISRAPLKPLELGGRSIRNSDLLTIGVIAIHRDPRWYSDPENFMPERFTPDFEKSLPKGTYIPFGTGPRVCIGNGFAMLEMQLVLADLIQRYHFSLPAGFTGVRPEFNITLGFSEPLKMQVAPR
jgi:cytochrome P450